MSPESSLPESNQEWFSRIAYLILTMLIQAAAFGVFIYSLTVLQWHVMDRWPFVVTEFLMVIMVTFGHFTVARELHWQIDLLDVLFPFLIGLLECVPMLLLGRVQKDSMWWFVCYLGLTNVSFVNLMNARLKTPHAVALPLVRRRSIVTITQPYILLLAIGACNYDWHVELVGAIFMVEQMGIFFVIYLSDTRTQCKLMESKTNDARQSSDAPQVVAGS
jgi:hypothetical protein